MSTARPKTPGQAKEKSNMDPVEVFCRLRPLERPDGEVCVEVVDDQTIQLHVPLDSSSGPEGGANKTIQCTFMQVFGMDATQKQVFDRAAYELVEELLIGKNGLLFTYGSTGSGKTYTMTGNPKNIGILPRCLDTVFNSIRGCQAGKLVFKPDHFNGFDIQSEAAAALERQQLSLGPPNVPKTGPSVFFRNRNGLDTAEWELCPRVIERGQVHCIDQDCAYSVFVSYVEIYNNYIYDLLDPQLNSINAPLSKILREDSKHNMYVNNVVEVEVRNTDEAFNVFISGQQHRRVAHTVLNTESSRSHSVFNIRVVQVPLDETGRDVILDKNKVSISQLSLVDLAGSERTSRTAHIGYRVREAGCINQSLMVLRQCFEQLRNNQQSGSEKMVPYRESRITHLFKNYFDGEGRVRMIICVNPVAEDYDENLHVVQFAKMTQEVQIRHALPVRFLERRLTPGRRRAVEIFKEVQDNLASQMPVITTSKPSLSSSSASETSLFPDMPHFPLMSLTLDNVNPLLCQLNSYFQMKLDKRRELLAESIQKDQQFEEALTEYICESRALKQRHQELSEELTGTRSQNDRYQADVHSLRTKVALLQRRLDRYEQNVKLMQNQEQLFKRREQEMEAKVRIREQKLCAVKQIFDDQAMMKYTTPSSEKPSCSTTSSCNIQRGPYQLLPQTCPPRSNGGNHHVPSYRVPSSPTRTTMSSFSARTGRRRSKSSSGLVIDHQPTPYSTPMGQVFQPKVHHRKVWCKDTNPKDLSKASEYILHHQEVDPTNLTGVCSTLVKGEVIPTAAGGRRVVFNDVERVTHRHLFDWQPPSAKQTKSDNEV